jgi:DNA (cytosine-5)-methyltransferase 1
MTAFLDLFSGIGGFALAAYWAGLRFDKHYFSEIEPYAIELYKKRFPEAEYLGDIKNVDYSKLPKGEYLVTAGFPCQPHSDAGKKQGAEDERDLWPECRRMLRGLRPRIALFENVRGLLTSPGRDRKGEFFNGVLSDIYDCGYAAEWQVISAADVGAPHLRKRVWIVAYSDYAGDRTYRNGINGDRQEKNEGREKQPQRQFSGLCPDVADTDNAATARQREHGGEIYAGTETIRLGCGSSFLSNTQREGLEKCDRERMGQPKKHEEPEPLYSETIRRLGEERRTAWAVEPDVGRVASRVPFRMDRLKGIGNSIVPQCAEMILRLPAFDFWRVSS